MLIFLEMRVQKRQGRTELQRPPLPGKYPWATLKTMVLIIPEHSKTGNARAGTLQRKLSARYYHG